MGLPPKLESLVTGTKGKLTVTLSGAKSATLDVVVDGGAQGPRILAQEPLTGPTTELVVPADRTGDIWLAAWVDTAGDGPDERDPVGYSSAAVVFDKAENKVTITVGEGSKPPAGSPFGKAAPAAQTNTGPAPTDASAPPPATAPPAATATPPAAGAPPAADGGAPKPAATPG